MSKEIKALKQAGTVEVKVIAPYIALIIIASLVAGLVTGWFYKGHLESEARKSVVESMALTGLKDKSQ